MNHIIKFIVFIGFFLMVFYNAAYAETMYVSDVLKLTVREGKGTGEKIISVVQSGQRVDVLQIEDEWALVLFDDGKEGWVLSRFLTSKTTNNVKLKWLQKKHKTLTVQAATLLEENTKLKKENKEIDSSLKKADKSVEELNKAYNTLKTESADYIKLKSKFKKTASQLAEYTEKSELLEKELTKLEFRQTIRWLLTGAGVLLLGFLIGFSSRSQRRRPTLR
ncbi:MAG: TIGR04211 family SH3 domain-containing protein [Deltaproteobacteria bacterium]|nr:TIGR04211 family SH3 domain-containing protein [Deltaproteobacteria bacterium]MBW2564273.1 TIGR04211 family SH3 domain-containing protein [Deltaproteobacteria bacterium]